MPFDPHAVLNDLYNEQGEGWTIAKTRNLIIEEAGRQGVDPALALSLAQRESGFNPGAISPTGVVGLFQVTQDTGAAYGQPRSNAERANPVNSARAGLGYLRKLLDDTGGNVEQALMRYNGGSDPAFAAHVLQYYPLQQEGLRQQGIATGPQMAAAGKPGTGGGQTFDPNKVLDDLYGPVTVPAPAAPPQAPASQAAPPPSGGPPAPAERYENAPMIGIRPRNAAPAGQAPPGPAIPPEMLQAPWIPGAMGQGAAATPEAPVGPDVLQRAMPPASGQPPQATLPRVLPREWEAGIRKFIGVAEPETPIPAPTLTDIGKGAAATAIQYGGTAAGAAIGGAAGSLAGPGGTVAGGITGAVGGSVAARKFNVWAGLEEPGTTGDVIAVVAPLLPYAKPTAQWVLRNTRGGKALVDWVSKTAEYDAAVKGQAGAIDRLREVVAKRLPEVPPGAGPLASGKMPTKASEVAYQQFDDIAGRAPVDSAPVKARVAELRTEAGANFPGALEGVFQNLEALPATTDAAEIALRLKEAGRMVRNSNPQVREFAQRTFSALHDTLEQAAAKAPNSAEALERLTAAKRVWQQEQGAAELQRLMARRGRGAILDRDEQNRLVLNVKELMSQTDKPTVQKWFDPADYADFRTQLEQFVGTPKMPKAAVPEPEIKPPGLMRRIGEVGITGTLGGLFTGSSVKTAVATGAVLAADQMGYYVSKAMLRPAWRDMMLKAIGPGGVIDPQQMARVAAAIEAAEHMGAGAGADEAVTQAWEEWRWPANVERPPQYQPPRRGMPAGTPGGSTR